MNRRSFMGAILGAAVAPAVVRAASLMPVRALESGVVTFGIDIQGVSNLDRYRFAEYQAAILQSIAEACEVPYGLLVRDFGACLYSSSRVVRR